MNLMAEILDSKNRVENLLLEFTLFLCQLKVDLKLVDLKTTS